MPDIAVQVENFGKKYRLRHLARRGTVRGYSALRDVVAESVKAPFRALARGNTQAANNSHTSSTSEDFWALKDICFKVGVRLDVEIPFEVQVVVENEKEQLLFTSHRSNSRKPMRQKGYIEFVAKCDQNHLLPGNVVT
jgi:hypothetical protein